MKQSPILHYDLYIKVKPELSYLRVTGAIKIDNPDNRDQITFVLNKNLNIKYIKDCNRKPLFFNEKSVTVDNLGDVNFITVEIPDELKYLKRYTLNVEYEGIIKHDDEQSLRLFEEDFMMVKSSDLMFPVMAEAESSSIEVGLRNVFTYDLQVELPKNCAAASAGKLLRITTTTHHKRFQFDTVHDVSSINIALSHYCTVKDKEHHINVYAFFEHKDFVNFVLMEKLKEYAENIELMSNSGNAPYISIIEVKDRSGITYKDGCIFVDEKSFNGEEENLSEICNALNEAASLASQINACQCNN